MTSKLFFKFLEIVINVYYWKIEIHVPIRIIRILFIPRTVTLKFISNNLTIEDSISNDFDIFVFTYYKNLAYDKRLGEISLNSENCKVS